MNSIATTEQAIIVTLAKMGPLAFGHLTALIPERRQRLGYALVRLRAQGKVVIHEHRWIENARGEDIQIPVYCALRPSKSGCKSANEICGPNESQAPTPYCPACGLARLTQSDPNENNQEENHE